MQSADVMNTDVLIIGSGAAGLSLALRLPQTVAITIVSKDEMGEGSTRYAQGGISAVLDSEDSMESHIQDTLIAGAGLCDEDAVRITVENGPECIQWLMDLGLPFTPDPNNPQQPHLTREGGHSHRRVAHVDDATGKAVATTLEQLVQRRANITVLESHFVVDLFVQEGRCHGAWVLHEQEVLKIGARFVALATGGASKVYQYSSNPESSTGDGIAMAYRAGCEVANMEFMQFHPTCLYHPKDRSFLITEAVRGEGGMLRRPHAVAGEGAAFMQDYDERKDLAPRDIVARSIDHQLKSYGLDYVELDITHKPAAFIHDHFPNINARLLSLGLDMTQEPIPVVPAAHYTCGGVVTDGDGQTNIHGLFAIGEVASTGLHGANRMASNSLLECLVYAKRAAEKMVADMASSTPAATPLPDYDVPTKNTEMAAVLIQNCWLTLRRLMWDYVGIVRSVERLQLAQRRLQGLREEWDQHIRQSFKSADAYELENILDVAGLIIRSALMRKESRGLHYCEDYLGQVAPQNTVLKHPNWMKET